MKLWLAGIAFLIQASLGQAQSYSSQSIFAHNDYLKSKPFHGAYEARVGFIEVDVFLQGNDLLVAHTRAEIKEGFNIERAYLQPLSERVRANEGNVYPDEALKLHLMVDIKTEALPTLQKLVEILSTYQNLTNCKNLFITVSGNMPSPVDWSWVPQFIYFDGRPGISYTEDQLKRVPLISTSFRNYSKWNGKRSMDARERGRLVEAITAIHLLSKPVRFWATPDTQRAWEELVNLGVDVINSDDLPGVVNFIRSKSSK